MFTAEELTAQRIAAYHQKNLSSATELFVQAIQIKASHEMAWLWLVSVLEDPGEQRYCLEKALAINPSRQPVRERIATLQSFLAVRPAAFDAHLSQLSSPTPNTQEYTVAEPEQISVETIKLNQDTESNVEYQPSTINHQPKPLLVKWFSLSDYSCCVYVFR